MEENTPLQKCSQRIVHHSQMVFIHIRQSNLKYTIVIYNLRYNLLYKLKYTIVFAFDRLVVWLIDFKNV